MPDLPESSTPVNLPTPDEGEPPEELASPPLVNPDDFDLYDVFRETFLRRFTRREDNAALRTLARLLLEMTCEFQHWWPDAREGDVRTLLRAVIADLRYLQGSLALTCAEIKQAADFSPIEEHHARLAGRMAEKECEIADTLEADLGPWRGEEE